MLSQPERACLVIADISGYTSYLSGAELDHAQDILADLMELVIGCFEPVLRFAKLEGDAVFAYAPEDGLDGSMLLDVIEHTYFAFQRRIQTIKRASTCECNACVLIPTLNLKFCTHNGSVVRHHIARQEELTGTDVIVVHRLLKNSVGETHGLDAYALFTAAAIDALGIDASAARMTPHHETYEHMGEIAVFVHDLQAAWTQMQASRHEFLTAENADITVTADIVAPPPLIWEYLTTPDGYSGVVPDVIRREQHGQGRRGVGSVTHCEHGQGGHTQVEEILEWRPFEDYTYRITDPDFGEVRATAELTPNDGTTHVRFSVRMESPEVRSRLADPEQGPALHAGAEEYRAMLEGWFVTIRAAAEEAVNARRGEFPDVAATRQELAGAAARYWETQVESR